MNFRFSTLFRMCFVSRTGLKAAAWLACLMAIGLSSARAQQQFQGLCAQVKIVIVQELTIERIGFEATLELTDNDGQDPITDFSAELTFENPLRSTNGVPNDASALFFVKPPTLQNIDGINGTGIVGPTKTAIIKWFIIPKISAGGISPNGVRYLVGAKLSGKFKGTVLPPEILQVFQDTISVKPEAQLDITYFQPRDVQGDDPFTPQVESPIPFTLGVLVKNSGYGIARRVKINSQQPQIVENRRHLLLVAQLLGARVMDSPRSGNLIVDLGDINPGETRKGAWDMITSLSGEFTEFKATYTHSSELGGEDTSVIKTLNAYFIAHEVLNDQPGRDGIKDFLADTDRDEALIPDALFESQGNVLPVNYLEIASLDGVGPSYQLSLIADREGWGYIRLLDPGQSRLLVKSVIRSDGKIVNTNNYWLNTRYQKGTNQRFDYLNLLDLVELQDYTYTVTYAPAGSDTTPPITTLNFSGVATFSDGKYYITPETQMFFLSEDESPVSIVYSLTNGVFRPALPFHISAPGEYSLRYYATDTTGNREATNFTTLVVYDEPPSLASITLGPLPMYAAGDALSIRPSDALVQFQSKPNPVRVDAQVEIYQGVAAWAQLGGTPSSPTRDTSAALSVSGDNVDYYRYRLDGAAWSAERSVASPITLSSLGGGSHSVSVLGRSQYGGYLADSNAISVAWVVSATAPTTKITGAPATPTHNRSTTLAVSGAGVTAYRWTINGGFYRAETPVVNPFALPALTGTQQVVQVIGKVGGVFQLTNEATALAWTVDPGYGADYSALSRVRSVNFTNIGTAAVKFAWNGRSDSGVLQPPGWYLVKITLRDELGRFSFGTRLVNMAELSGAQSIVADTTRGPRNPHAHGHWAVWQDQSDGNFEIYAQDLHQVNSSIVQVTSGVLNQENAKTDGRYVVWQSRQVNGNWDIWLKDLTTSTPAQPVTSSPGVDEINPAIDWPWVVFQTRPTANAAAPWQLHAFNLSSGLPVEVDPGPLDQTDPNIQAGRVVWQDQRDVGQGEIYFKNLETGERRRITTNTFGQYFPDISDSWIVWQDNRNITVDIYGFDLRRKVEVRLTPTSENEARPFLDGPWLVCEEDSLGALTANIRLIHLPSLRSVPVTRTLTAKGRPALASGQAVWQETVNGQTRIVTAALPALQGVFQNQNAIPITPALAAYQKNAFNLLALWNAQASVQEVVHYSSLVPNLVSESARWVNGQAQGSNFALTPGSSVWVRFNDRRVLDLGIDTTSALNLQVGVNVINGTAFPSRYSAYQLMRQLGLSNVLGVRMLDANAGRWVVAAMENGHLVGEDFRIPNVAVVLVDLSASVNQFRPE